MALEPINDINRKGHGRAKLADFREVLKTAHVPPHHDIDILIPDWFFREVKSHEIPEVLGLDSFTTAMAVMGTGSVWTACFEMWWQRLAGDSKGARMRTWQDIKDQGFRIQVKFPDAI